MSRVRVTGGGVMTGRLVKTSLRSCLVHHQLPDLSNDPLANDAPPANLQKDEKKAGLLRALPGAAERLRLFQADMYDADTFEPAIAGCEFVFLVATPLAHDPTSTKVRYVSELMKRCDRSSEATCPRGRLLEFALRADR
ncbi:anthocyanidin reductase-like [Panicum miliaceum]|uniref:Anthocyanidin reductase-like n=1 Tax=Panicum miliaceum TaxID=4540 RepID=A0A3L6TDS9_PANMI|nr:anthocyanidin reductase-like [Panicum miliaceum]